jgi:hypothetical protein
MENYIVRLLHIITPGIRVKGCCECCHAPDYCPVLAYCCCFDYPAYIVNKVNSSRYIYVREHSVEWNNPLIQQDKGPCFGVSCCDLAVLDNVSVIYYDDLYFDTVRNGTRSCNDCQTFWCGGRGEKVTIQSRFCLGLCKRGRGSVCFVPSYCPTICCPCISSPELWVEDAESAVKLIQDARDSAVKRIFIER